MTASCSISHVNGSTDHNKRQNMSLHTACSPPHPLNLTVMTPYSFVITSNHKSGTFIHSKSAAFLVAGLVWQLPPACCCTCLRTLECPSMSCSTCDAHVCRCRHAVAAVGSYIFIYGGLKGSTLLDDFLLAEDGGGSQMSICDPRSPTWSVLQTALPSCSQHVPLAGLHVYCWPMHASPLQVNLL